MLAFLLHDGTNGGVAVWSNYAKSQLDVDIKTISIDNTSTSVNLKSFSYHSFLAIYREIISKEIKLVVVGNSTPAVLIRLVKLFKPSLRIIYVTHGWGWSYQKGVKRIVSFIIEFITLPLVDCVVSISSRDRSICKEYFFRESILLRNVSFKTIPQRAKPKDIKKVLFVGRDAYPKRLDLYKQLARRFEEISFYIVGAKGHDTENLFHLGEIIGFNDYANYDAFILLSDSEGSPLVVQEALGAGLPCLVNRLDYVCDLELEWKNLLHVAESLAIEKLDSSFRSMINSKYMNRQTAKKKMEELQLEWHVKFNAIIKKHYD